MMSIELETKDYSNNKILTFPILKSTIQPRYESFFDSISKMALKLCEVPFVSIVFNNDSNVLFRSSTGQTEISEAINSEILSDWISSHEGILQIKDTLRDCPNPPPFSLSHNRIRFYCGIKINLPSLNLEGILSVYDRKPGKLSGYQINTLRGLADIIEKTVSTIPASSLDIHTHNSH